MMNAEGGTMNGVGRKQGSSGAEKRRRTRNALPHRSSPITRHPLVLFLLLPALLLGVPESTPEGFAVPQPGHAFAFPRDHGNHPDFKIEWWYLTGHLQATGGERFGFQATFFRSAMRAPAEQASDGSEPSVGFGRDHLFLAHVALTEVDGNRFHHEERLNRNGWDATAALDRLDLRNGNWALRQTGDDPHQPTLELTFTVADDTVVELALEPLKPLVVFGEDGTSRKGPEPTARSYYLTWPRLRATGTIRAGTIEPATVSGLAWMDHEIASQQLGEALTGWDWTAIQLDDGWDVKAYILRQADGTPSPYSALIWIDPEGRTTYRSAAEFRWNPVRAWTSPATGARYPIEVEITTTDPRTGAALALRLVPLRDDQELAGGSAGFAYWEGACAVQSPSGERLGQAYLELVGYGGPIGRGLR